MENLFQGLFDTATTTVISVETFLTCIACALGIGLFLSFAYAYKTKHTASFILTMAIIPAIVCVVIMMVNGNVGAGVAVAGTFSLVRFRSVPGTAREIAAIFLAMGTGLMCGMGYLAYAVLFSVIMGVGMMIFTTANLGGKSEEERTLIISIPENMDYADAFDDMFEEYTAKADLYEVKSTNMGSLFKLTYRVILKDIAKSKAMLDEIRVRNGNLDVALVRATEGLEAL